MPTSSSEEKSAKKISDARQHSLKLSKAKLHSITSNLRKTKSDINSITQKKAKHGKSKHGKHLTINSRTQTLALKFYPEQMLNAETRKAITNPETGRIDYSLWKNGNLLEMCKKRMRDLIENFDTNYANYSVHDKHKHHWQIEAICHDRDEVANEDDMFEPSAVKPHFHVILRDADKNRFLVKTILKVLKLNYQKQDSSLFFNSGCTTIFNFNAYSVYLTHETEQAIRDGKEFYELSEVMTNMSLDELKAVRAGYNRLQAKSKLSETDWNELAEYVAGLGDKMDDFQAWADKTLTFSQQTNSKFLKLQQVYNRHLLKAVEQSPDIIRCCVLIFGKFNDGKSYTARHALMALGETVYNARQGSGKYDGLRHEASAMLFDDRKMTDSLNVTDNRATVLHSRGTGNDKPWVGRYVVITTNQDPDEFFRDQVQDDSQVEALRSRFYVATITYDYLKFGHLQLSQSSIRGSKSDIIKRNALYTRFADKFNELIKQYHPLSKNEAPKLDAKYYDFEVEDKVANAGSFQCDTTSVLFGTVRNMINLVSETKPNWLYYTAELEDRDSLWYQGLVNLLKSVPDNTKIFQQNAANYSWTAAELLEILQNNFVFQFGAYCMYIRIGY